MHSEITCKFVWICVLFNGIQVPTLEFLSWNSFYQASVLIQRTIKIEHCSYLECRHSQASQPASVQPGAQRWLLLDPLQWQSRGLRLCRPRGPALPHESARPQQAGPDGARTPKGHLWGTLGLGLSLQLGWVWWKGRKQNMWWQAYWVWSCQSPTEQFPFHSMKDISNLLHK